MGEIATLKGLKCPQCGSENLRPIGKKGAKGTAVAASLVGGAAANLIASKSASKNGNQDVTPLSYACNECKHKFQSLPLEAPEEDVLSEPCTINFTRLKSMVGAIVVQTVYLNGVNCGPIKNGKTITLQTSSRWNTMFVLDQYGVAFPSVYQFEATPGGTVDVKFQRKFKE